MASRRRAREFALQALYEADLAERPITTALADLWSGLVDGEGLDDGRAPESEEVEFAQLLAMGVAERQTEIDALIDACSTNWRLSRMPVVDRNILRMSAVELQTRNDSPPNVTINEAVELAKRFGTAESRAFVNGMVDRMARQIGRLPRKDS